ncbi:Major facilitator superfamily domain,Major facilitator superfamily associated domain [Cinara cedri]|uniref:Major facilitator superfamily domain,Major facilitator superfamily associated domain n=1 Tax=Cinara cedri TaxID=506608 RepID=A0A5E4N460_9HEMI|nr:Major facilitator superfamily domain,Major facilitator superfamily associated domain [Cinara cedri]
MKVNKILLPIKANYFLLDACIGPIVGFLPTIVKQLGYSVTTYGVVMTFMALTTIPLLPTVGVIVDKFRIKKFLMMTSLFGVGFMTFLFMYVPKVPVEMTAALELTCDWKTRNLVIRIGNDQNTVGDKTIFTSNDADYVLFTYELLVCRSLGPINYDVNDQTGRSNASRRVGSIGHLSSRDWVDVAFKLKDVKTVGSSYVFNLASVHVNGKETLSITCTPGSSSIVFRPIQCSSEAVMRLATDAPYLKRNVLGLYQFWTSFLRRDKPEDFGKQRCWASIGWGLFSIIIGWLVDVFNIGKNEKDYSPVFYSGVVLTIINLYVVTYMEEKAKVNNDRNHLLKWIKTLQGLVQGVQCLDGEIPFFFWSGWIIKNARHANCMALTLGCMAIKMYLYTVVPNPTWIVLVELLNGLSFALGSATKMSYAKLVAPPDTLYTVIGLIGLVDNIGQSLGSLLGGYVFGTHGGVWSFRFFSSGAALMCSLTILTTRIFRLTENLKKSNYIAITGEHEF